jgi:uncharacterized cupin superfamily protein
MFTERSPPDRLLLMPEAPLTPRTHGSSPEGEGWFVLNAREAQWLSGAFGAYTRFEGDVRFGQFGVNIGVLQPGEASCYYHAENEQEDFLVLSGECLLIVEEQERPLRQWDFVHCPQWTRHVFVGAGDGPCALLAVGTRLGDEVVYPDSAAARRHNAGVTRRTTDPDEAYAQIAPDEPVGFDPRWLG